MNTENPHPENTEQIADELLTTKGVNSPVFTDGELTGHVQLADYDDLPKGGESDMWEEVEDLPGVTAVFQSSPDSYHVWNLTVRPFGDTLEELLWLHGDMEHVAIGFRRGYWTLRFWAKERTTGHGGRIEEYKTAPEPVELIANPTTEPQSIGHWNLLKYLLPVDPPRPDREVTEWVGEDIQVMQYMTITDELKREIRNG